MTDRRASIHDAAREAGVSVTPVSRALNGKGRGSPRPPARIRVRRVTAAAVVTAFAMTACGGTSDPAATVPTAAPDVHVLEATVAVRGDGATLGFAAHNAGTATDDLVAASCACAEHARTVGDTSIDSQQTVVFSAEGPHVRLAGLDPGLEPGGFTDVTLTFAEAGDVVVPAEIVRP